MKAQKIIDNYCRLYGITTPAIDYNQTQYFVTISPAGANVLHLQKSTRLLGQVIGAAMKRGTVLHIHNGWVAPLTWEKWKQTWGRFFAPKPRKSYAPQPDLTRPYKSEMFEEMRQEHRPYHKPQKHGFSRTFSANQIMDSLGHPSFKIRMDRINP